MRGEKRERGKEATMSLLLAAGSPAVSAAAHCSLQCLNYSQAQCTLQGHAALCVFSF